MADARRSRSVEFLSVPLALVLVVVFAATAPAAEAELSLSAPVSYGDTVILQVAVVNPERGIGPPQLGAVDGLAISGPYGPSSSMEMTQGVRRVSLVYQYKVTPNRGRTGTFTIGPVRFSRRGGTPLASNTVELAAYKRPPVGLRFTCEVAPEEGDVAEKFRVVYKLHYPVQQRQRRPSLLDLDDVGGSLKGLELPILEQPGLRVRSVTALPRQRVIRQKLGETTILFQESFTVGEDGTAHQTMIFAFEVEPLRTGNIDLGGARAVMALMTGRTVKRRRFFDVEEVPEVKRFEAEVEACSYTVRPLPPSGRPQSFTGAIGRYSITVTTGARDVAAFDPIELEIRVDGEGFVDELQAPAWNQVEDLRKDFEVATDVDLGKVEGNAKIFRQVIRARHERVTQIPKIPFPYYDPWLKKYAVAYSRPLPISVRAVKTVGAKEAIVSPGTAPTAKTAPSAPAAILEEEGVRANFTELGQPSVLVTPRKHLFSPVFLGTVVLPPALFVLVLLGSSLLRRHPAQRERRKALAQARAALSAAGDDQEAVSRAFQDYVRLRFDLPPGEVTPPQLRAELERRGLSGDAACRAADLLEGLLAGRFGGGASVSDPGNAAIQLVREVERCGIR